MERKANRKLLMIEWPGEFSIMTTTQFGSCVKDQDLRNKKVVPVFLNSDTVDLFLHSVVIKDCC